VGAGSAGCVLANRLSENPESSVLIIEAGGSEDKNPNIPIPIASGNIHLSDEDWKFRTVPQKKACLAMNERVHQLITCFIHMYILNDNLGVKWELGNVNYLRNDSNFLAKYIHVY
jgi:choline dehydrogenase-like flavoprotein